MSADSIRVLFVTSECAPLVKTGGLADVSGALPAALARLSVDVRILLPGYRAVLGGLTGAMEVARLAATPYLPAARLLQADGPGGISVLVVDCPELYNRAGGPYQDEGGAEWPDNALRFGQFCRIAAELASARSPLGWCPQVVHCNDWQTGLVPAYLSFDRGARAASLLTIHNLAFQGIFAPQFVGELGLPPESFNLNGAEYYGKLSFLKAAIRYADALSTVSPTYADEIQREPLGMGLQGLLFERRAVLEGILNGIDTGIWDPRRDPMIAQTYDADSLEGKRQNKRALQARLGLAPDPDAPLFALVSRLTSQKGIDLFLAVADTLLALPAQVAVLGTGDPVYEEALRALAARHSGRAGVVIGFDETLAHLIEAGADIFLMPSRFEPSGMNQMYSQHYGTVPIVHATGGLLDSVVDASPGALADGTAAGFVFRDASAESLLSAALRSVEMIRKPVVWRALQRAGMARDFSWHASARRYREIYARLARP